MVGRTEDVELDSLVLTPVDVDVLDPVVLVLNCEEGLLVGWEVVVGGTEELEVWETDTVEDDCVDVVLEDDCVDVALD